MTSISPNRNTICDNDLSTLSNIRLNNRKSKQKFSNNVLKESNRPYTKSRLGANYDDYDELAELKFLNTNFSPSPVKEISFNPTTSKRSYKFTPLRSKPTTKNESLDIDESLLEKENLRYLDEDFYSQGSKLNQLKRDRFLNQITSPIPERDTRGDSNHDFDEIYNIKSLDLSPVREQRQKSFKDLGFRPRNKDIQIPNLRYDDADLKGYTKESRWESPVKSRSEFDLDDELDLLNYEKQELRNYDQHFERLVDKYGLSEQLSKPSPMRPNFKERLFSRGSPEKTNQKNIIDHSLEDKLERYRSMIKRLQLEKQSQTKESQELGTKLVEVEKFVDFLESKFDQLYKKMNILQLEKQNFHKTNQELIFINNYYKVQLKKQEKTKSIPLASNDYNPSNDDTISLIQNDTVYGGGYDYGTMDTIDQTTDDSTTYNLLNFSTTRRSKTFHKLNSKKKFKALAFTVIASVRLQNSVKLHQAYINKIRNLMI